LPCISFNNSITYIISKQASKYLVNYSVRIKEAVEKMGGMIKQLLSITKVHTKNYVDDVSVLDLEGSSETEAIALPSNVKVVEKRLPGEREE